MPRHVHLYGMEYDEILYEHEAYCESCGGVFDKSEIIGGICESCARRYYDDRDGVLFAAEHMADFKEWLNGKLPDTEAESIGRDSFEAKYHVSWVQLDEYACEVLKWKA